jgi:isopenicillin-N epimerase
MDRTWRFLSRAKGFAYIRKPIPVPVTTAESFLAELWKGVTPRTRVIFLSHITSPTALIFPVEAVVRRARQEGILTVIDGAHVPGQLDLNLDALGADFYGGNLHKWLSAPKGAGFLYARAGMQPLLKPLVVSWGYEPENPGPSSFVDQQEWWGTRDMSAFLAVPEAIRFQRANDWDRIRSACHELLRQAQAQIEALTGLAPFHPDDPAWYCQMAGAPLPALTDAPTLKQRLYDEYRIEIPVIDWNGCKLLRMSAQGYNRRTDFSRLLAALQKLLTDR